MELQDELLEKEKKSRKNIIEKKSIQYNCQDLDQEQKVDVNPVQLNTQNVHVFISYDKNNYSGKITGTTFLEKNKEIAKNANILLFFGYECRHSVYKTNSDNNGNFIIDDIPPGYYSLFAELGENLKYQSHFIKVFPGQNVHLSILLK